MSTSTTKPAPVDRHASYDKKKLFVLSVIALVTAGLSFGIRSSIANDLQTTFFDPIDRLRSAGLIGIFIGKLDLNWQVKLSMVLLPAITFGILCLTMKFPPTERVASGIPASETFKEVTRPFFIVWFLAMFLTAASELAPGQWVD